MPTYPILDPAWRDAFPNVLTILQDERIKHHGDLARYGEVLAYSHYLSAEHTAQVESVASALNGRSSHDVAGELEGWGVPNGVFEVTGISETFRYNVHLVTSGDLAGQRVLKRYIEGRYKAFAFITRTGTMKIWRRFVADLDEAYVTTAEELLHVIREVGRDRLFSERSFRIPTRAMTVEFTPRCFHCNAQQVVSNATCQGSCGQYDCIDAHPAARISLLPVWVDREAEREIARRAAQERRERLEAQRAALAAQEAQRAAERVQRARERILRSEITPTEVR